MSDKPRGRGRPAIDAKPMLVRLSPDVLVEIDEIAGVGKRAEFIRAAVDQALARERRLRRRAELPSLEALRRITRGEG